MGGGFRLHYTMRLPELPELYRDLLNLRLAQSRESIEEFSSTYDARFTWSATPEGISFWRILSRATVVADLLPIPESSIQELIDLNTPNAALGPMNTDPIFSENNRVLHPEFQTLAQQRRHQLGDTGENEPNTLMCAFAWNLSPEGSAFWNRVNEDRSTTTDLAIAIEANSRWSNTNQGERPELPKTKEPSTPEPKKHSTMEDVFAGMNRHAKKEDNKETITEEDKVFNRIAKTTIAPTDVDLSRPAGGYLGTTG